jgi:hypothetical protein
MKPALRWEKHGDLDVAVDADGRKRYVVFREDSIWKGYGPLWWISRNDAFTETSKARLTRAIARDWRSR